MDEIRKDMQTKLKAENKKLLDEDMKMMEKQVMESTKQAHQREMEVVGEIKGKLEE